MATDKSILEAAQRYTTQGKYNEAIAEWKKIADASPSDGIPYNSIGDLHLKRNAPGDAAEAFFKAAAAFRAGGVALKAIAVYKKILKIDPNQFKAYQFLADLNAERGLVGNAVADYTALGKMYIKANKFKEALETYRAVLKLEPTNLEAKRQMADLCLKHNWLDEATKIYLEVGHDFAVLHKPAEAKEAYKTVLRINPNNRDAKQFLEALERGAEPPPISKGSSAMEVTGRFVAITDLSKASKKDLLTYAQSQMESGQFSVAEAALSELLGRQPGDPEVCRLLARVHLKAGQIVVARGEIQFLAESAIRGAQDYALAESMIQEYLQVNPTCVTMLELLGKVFEQNNDPTNAAVHYGRAVELLLEHPDPENPTLPLELYEKIKEIAPSSDVMAKLTQLFETGKTAAPAESEPATQEAASEAPALSEQDLLTRFELGVAYKDMGLVDEALEELEVALQGPTCFVNASHAMALCLKERGKSRQAIEYLEQAVADPGCVGDLATMVRYDLGLLYEAEGEAEKAFKTFSVIPSYRDVPKRLNGSPR